MKRYIYGLPLILLATYFVYIGWYVVAALLAGFLIGFVIAVDRIYKKATGKKLDNDELTDVLEKIL